MESWKPIFLWGPSMVTVTEGVTVLSFGESHTLAQHGSTPCRRPPSVHASNLATPSALSATPPLHLAPTVEAAGGKNQENERSFLIGRIYRWRGRHGDTSDLREILGATAFPRPLPSLLRRLPRQARQGQRYELLTAY
jgi:hypothetical protein